MKFIISQVFAIILWFGICVGDIQIDQNPLNISVSDLMAIAESHIVKADYASRARKLVSAMKHTSLVDVAKRNGFLCSTFIKWDVPTQELLVHNMNHSAAVCDWLIVVYDSQDHTNFEMELHLRNQLQAAGVQAIHRQGFFTIVTAPHKQDSMEAFRVMCENYAIKHIHEDFIQETDPCGIVSSTEFQHFNPSLYSKASLFLMTLEYLPKYKYVWTLDSDIDLRSLDLMKFFHILQCSFKHTPIISQPLIHENTQFYRYLHKDSWKNVKALASGVGFIEIQAPIFETSFLEYFIMAFILPILPAMVVLGGDWGIDEMFCAAGKEFMRHEKKGIHEHPICAVVLDNMSVNHRNRGEIANTVGLEIKRHLNFGLMKIVHENLGQFCQNGLLYFNDPFNVGTHYKKVYKLRSSCDA